MELVSSRRMAAISMSPGAMTHCSSIEVSMFVRSDETMLP
jgi:hypothetical protein